MCNHPLGIQCNAGTAVMCIPGGPGYSPSGSVHVYTCTREHSLVVKRNLATV